MPTYHKESTLWLQMTTANIQSQNVWQSEREKITEDSCTVPTYFPSELAIPGMELKGEQNLLDFHLLLSNIIAAYKMKMTAKKIAEEIYLCILSSCVCATEKEGANQIWCHSCWSRYESLGDLARGLRYSDTCSVTFAA